MSSFLVHSSPLTHEVREMPCAGCLVHRDRNTKSPLAPSSSSGKTRNPQLLAQPLEGGGGGGCLCRVGYSRSLGRPPSRLQPEGLGDDVAAAVSKAGTSGGGRNGRGSGARNGGSQWAPSLPSQPHPADACSGLAVTITVVSSPFPLR